MTRDLETHPSTFAPSTVGSIVLVGWMGVVVEIACGRTGGGCDE